MGGRGLVAFFLISIKVNNLSLLQKFGPQNTHDDSVVTPS